MDVDGVSVTVTDDKRIAPFSVAGRIVMSRVDYMQHAEMILAHEMSHVRLRHWIDLLIAQTFTIFQWYNPFAWMMRSELRTLHEYQADEAVLRSGIDMRAYQILLVEKASGMKFSDLANSLNHSQLHRRVKMMLTSGNHSRRRLRALVVIPCIIGTIFIGRIPAIADAIDNASRANINTIYQFDRDRSNEAPKHDEVSLESLTTLTTLKALSTLDSLKPSATPQSEQSSPKETTTPVIPITTSINVVGHVADNTANKSDAEDVDLDDGIIDAPVYDVVEQRPQYPGGEGALLRRLTEMVRYPAEAMSNKTQGRVVLQFTITPEGKVTNPEILRGVSPELDKEDARVVMALDNFEPGRIGGKPVAVKYTLPLVFKLSGDELPKGPQP